MPNESFLRHFYTAKSSAVCTDLALLVVRLGFGGMMLLGHGWGKLSKFGELAETFPDPIGLGSRVSLCMAVFAEFFCAGLLMAGLLTRLAVIPLIGTMAVAGFIVHANDPFQTKEKAWMYLVVFVALLLTGAGRFSLDHAIGSRRK